MKMDLLNEDHFDQEVIKDGMERREERDDYSITQAHFEKQKAEDLPPMTKEEIAAFVQELKGEDYKLMDIQAVAAKKVNRYRKLLFYVNVPLMIGIPAFLESGVFLAYYEHKL